MDDQQLVKEVKKLSLKLKNIFQNKAKHLHWERFPQDKVAEGFKEEAIEQDQAYFLIRMREMYIAHTRILWRKFYPMLHGYVSYGDKEEHVVVGPGQLRGFGESNLDRIMTFNYRLAGPIAYKGGDVTLLVGLYSVPAQDASEALINTIGMVAGLSGISLGQVNEIAGIVKDGVEKILDLNNTSINVGVCDTFFQNNPFNTGYYIAINAPKEKIQMNSLWLKDGRLLKGDDPIQAKPYDDFDYFVLEIEKKKDHENWIAIPGIMKINEKIASIMRDTILTVEEKRKRLTAIWPEFIQILVESPQLIKPHREKIAGDVLSDLLERLKAMEIGSPFESRAWGDDETKERPAEEFDFTYVPDYFNIDDETDLQKAATALKIEKI